MLRKQKKTAAQQVLDKLLAEGEIPFELTIGKLLNEGPNYTIHFHDSRMFGLEFSCEDSESFQELFRAAVLDRVKRITGPLPRNPATP